MENSQPDEKSEEKKQDEESEKAADDKSSETTTDKDDQKKEPEEDTVQKEEKKELPELTKDDTIKILKTFSGVGQVTAERIFDAGFDNREKLKVVTVEDLKKITGVGQVMAEDISKNIESAINKFDEPVKEEEEKKDGKGITDKAIGFVKGTISKITGFFKGKSPKAKSKAADESKITETDVDKQKTEPKSDLDSRSGELESTKEGASEDSYFPEVGSPKEEVEEKPKHEPVSVESSDTEPASELLEPEKEVKEQDKPDEKLQEPKPEPEPEPEPEPKVNLTDSSGLLIWFEATPNLRPEAGKLLFKAGYNNLEELMEAVVDDLVLVNGINEVEAKTIYSELRKLH
jgi:ERCC4-type nuclease